MPIEVEDGFVSVGDFVANGVNNAVLYLDGNNILSADANFTWNGTGTFTVATSVLATASVHIDSTGSAELTFDRGGTSFSRFAIQTWRTAGINYFAAGLFTTANNFWQLQGETAIALGVTDNGSTCDVNLIENSTLSFGNAKDATISHTGAVLKIIANAVISTDTLQLEGADIDFGDGVGTSSWSGTTQIRMGGVGIAADSQITLGRPAPGTIDWHSIQITTNQNANVIDINKTAGSAGAFVGGTAQSAKMDLFNVTNTDTSQTAFNASQAVVNATVTVSKDMFYYAGMDVTINQDRTSKGTNDNFVYGLKALLTSDIADAGTFGYGLDLTMGTANITGIRVEAHASQTSDLVRIEDSSNADIFVVDGSGGSAFTLPGAHASRATQVNISGNAGGASGTPLLLLDQLTSNGNSFLLLAKVLGGTKMSLDNEGDLIVGQSITAGTVGIFGDTTDSYIQTSANNGMFFGTFQASNLNKGRSRFGDGTGYPWGAKSPAGNQDFDQLLISREWDMTSTYTADGYHLRLTDTITNETGGTRGFMVWDTAGTDQGFIQEGGHILLINDVLSKYGTAGDGTIGHDGDSLNIIANAVTTTDSLQLTAGSYTFNVPAGTDIAMNFAGTANSGLWNWMEDEDYFLYSDDIALDNAEFIIFDKASGNGFKVDTTTPTFGFADILGDQFSKNTGATKPTLTTYNGVINAWLFAAGDEAYISFHIPHDYVLGSDIFLHIHWSHIGTFVTGGTITFKATSIYAKGHNQAAFTGTPAVGTFTGTASTTQYQHILSETQYSASTPTGLQVDTDLLEPDGVIEMTFEVDVNGITVSEGAVPGVFVHFVDIHYQTTGLIGTKAKAPDFYA